MAVVDDQRGSEPARLRTVSREETQALNLQSGALQVVFTGRPDADRSAPGLTQNSASQYETQTEGSVLPLSSESVPELDP